MNIPPVLRSTSCLGEALVYPCSGPVISRMLLDLSLPWNGRRLCGNVWCVDLLLSKQSIGPKFSSVASPAHSNVQEAVGELPRMRGQPTLEITCVDCGIVALDLLDCSDISLVYCSLDRVCIARNDVGVSAAKAQTITVRLSEFMQCTFHHTHISFHSNRIYRPIPAFKHAHQLQLLPNPLQRVGGT
jgi:hypothetical protein